jgi:hypothetical protein
MAKITIKKSTLDMVATHAVGGRMNTTNCAFHPASQTVTIDVDDEVYDGLEAEIDDITPTFDDVLERLCHAGSGYRGH